jgi:hypothetical protein
MSSVSNSVYVPVSITVSALFADVLFSLFLIPVGLYQR